MKKFFILFCIPSAAIEAWKNLPDAEKRKADEQEMMTDWRNWMEAHKDAFLETGSPLGKNKRVTSDGVTNVGNDLNWYAIVQAESHDAAAKLFEGHPHLRIPTSYIEVVDMPQMTA